LLLPLAAALLVWSFWYLGQRRRQKLLCWTLAGAFAAVLVGTFEISGGGGRWYFPMLNVVGRRILTSPERTAFFEARGMPVNARLQQMAGEFGGGQNWAFYAAPELEGFRTWLRVNGRRVYAEDLTTHPVRTLLEPLRDVEQFSCPALIPYAAAGFVPLLPRLDGSLACRRKPALAAVFGSLAVGGALLTGAFVRRGRMPAPDAFHVLTAAAMLLGWLPFVWVTWHMVGDMEIGRHVWHGTLAFRIGLLLLAMFPLKAFARSRLLAVDSADLPPVRGSAARHERRDGVVPATIGRAVFAEKSVPSPDSVASLRTSARSRRDSSPHIA
jgi:hypothetical protein